MRALILILSLGTVGCQSMIYGTASELNGLSVGMSKEKVIELLGSPVSTHADGDKAEEYLIFKKMKHTISAWPRTYQVTLRSNKVVKWAEQYDERNINEY